MAKLILTACDTCSSTADVETYEVKAGDKKVRVDLCGEHGAPLLEILSAAPASAPARAPRAAADPEKAAARKAARERRAAKKAAEKAETPAA